MHAKSSGELSVGFSDRSVWSLVSAIALSKSLSPNEKNDFTFLLIFGLSPNLGLSESLSKRLIQKVKWPIVSAAIFTVHLGQSVVHRESFADCWKTIFYRLDAVPVTQSTAAKQCLCYCWLTFNCLFLMSRHWQSLHGNLWSGAKWDGLFLLPSQHCCNTTL